MFEYVKTILSKVAFSEELFKNELYKSDRWLSEQEQQSLTQWCKVHYYDMYPDIIKEYENKINDKQN